MSKNVGLNELTAARRKLALPHLPKKRLSQLHVASSPAAAAHCRQKLPRRPESWLFVTGGGSPSIEVASTPTAAARRSRRRAISTNNASALLAMARRQLRRAAVTLHWLAVDSSEPTFARLTLPFPLGLRQLDIGCTLSACKSTSTLLLTHPGSCDTLLPCRSQAR